MGLGPGQRIWHVYYPWWTVSFDPDLGKNVLDPFPDDIVSEDDYDMHVRMFFLKNPDKGALYLYLRY